MNEIGVVLIAAGLLLAPLVHEPWHLYATLGTLVGGGSVCLGYTARPCSCRTGSSAGVDWQ